MTRRMRVLAIVMLGAAVPACSVLAGLTEDYRLAGDAGGVTPPGEGGADGDVDKDGALPDGFAPDGGTDAPIDQLVSDGGRFCDSVQKANLDFCDDFEAAPIATGLPPTWTKVQNDVGAVLKVVAGGMAGGAHGLDVDGTTASTNTSRNAFLVKTLPAAVIPANYLTYDVEFDFMMIETAADYDAVGVLNFTGAATEDHGVAVYPGEAVVGRLTPKTSGVAPAVGLPWHHAHISLSHATAGTPFNRKITIDGEVGAAIVDMTSGHSTAGAATGELRIGTFYTGYGAGRVHAVFDNIVVHRSK